MTFSGPENIVAIEPISIFRAQSDLGTPPLEDAAASGDSSLDSEQVAAVLGEPVPIVFGRRVDGVGGVFVSPKATEARYANNAVSNELTVNLELVLSEGELPLLQIRDVFQRACRVGTWAQAYDARAGSWNPGNATTVVAGKTPWNCPVYCGTSGSYEDITTLSYTNTHADADDTWNKQVHAFVRQGLQVTRILDSVYGSSNNYVDLVLYLLDKTKRVSDTLIDSAAMLTAAEFTNENGFFFNGILQESQNLEDWLYDTSIGFLLRFSDRDGKKILKPRLPINEDFTIKTTAITPVFGFTEEHIVPGSFQIDYVPLSDRIPTCIVVLWRQQPDDDIGIIRNTEVRFEGEALTGPYEQRDLSAYCTSEDHAVKVGTYLLARRKYITHNLRISVKPDAYNSTLELGDIVRVQLRRETDAIDFSLHDYFYEVERINKNTSGIVDLDLTHFPIDGQNRSLVALKVAEAVGEGYEMPTGRSNFSCDLAGRRTDTSTITELPDPDPPVIPDPDNFEYNAPKATITTDTTPLTLNGVNIPGTRNDNLNSLGGVLASGSINNPEDPVEEQAPDITGATGDFGRPVNGDDLETAPPCPDGRVTWYKRPKDGGERTQLQQDDITGSGTSTYTVGTDDIDYVLEADTQCPDPSSPDGYGSPLTQTTGPVEANYNFYNYVRWTGELVAPGGTTQTTSGWFNISAGNMAATIGPVFGCALFGVPLESDSLTTCPPIGPVNWRSVSTTVNKGTNPTGYYAIGGLAVYDKFAPVNANACSNSIAVQWGGTVENRVISVSGKWEFSVNGSTVAAVWEGRTDQSEGE
ncbi:MAG: hypothetical protein EBV32_00110 [Proteobacteria bacterium]|uniref:Uncharacterized protein n=1 Tax=Candidatus Fonsibacter lacus TaxID=2576439 RepID=A0A964UYY1_9PROT|nr:hypothetical protein [Candidatus Fonsibacter lacus]NCU72157.1 hypothetical protein [Candidatus Fonsibacter lacus]